MKTFCTLLLTLFLVAGSTQAANFTARPTKDEISFVRADKKTQLETLKRCIALGRVHANNPASNTEKGFGFDESEMEKLTAWGENFRIRLGESETDYEKSVFDYQTMFQNKAASAWDAVAGIDIPVWEENIVCLKITKLTTRTSK